MNEQNHVPLRFHPLHLFIHIFLILEWSAPKMDNMAIVNILASVGDIRFTLSTILYSLSSLLHFCWTHGCIIIIGYHTLTWPPFIQMKIAHTVQKKFLASWFAFVFCGPLHIHISVCLPVAQSCSTHWDYILLIIKIQIVL